MDEDRDLQDPPQPGNSDPESSDSGPSWFALVSRDLQRTQLQVEALRSELAFLSDKVDNLQVQRDLQERSLDALQDRLRTLEAEALQAAADLYFRVDALSAIVNQLTLRVRSFQSQLLFLGGLPENTDTTEWSLHALD